MTFLNIFSFWRTVQHRFVMTAFLVLIATSAHASERVLVSVPPLFSLVSILLEGVDTPGLLFRDEASMKSPDLSPENIKRINQADMVIWAGAQFETNLAAHSFKNPHLSAKDLTVTETIPTFTTLKKGDRFLHANPHDMRFWLDPRLTKAAIARMSTKLVTLYPDQYEYILENEAALRKLLMEMETSMRQSLKSEQGVPLNVPDSDVLYLAWRYNLKVPKCPEAAKKLDGFQFEFGTEHYFTMMLQLLKDLKRCQNVAPSQS